MYFGTKDFMLFFYVVHFFLSLIPLQVWYVKLWLLPAAFFYIWIISKQCSWEQQCNGTLAEKQPAWQVGEKMVQNRKWCFITTRNASIEWEWNEIASRYSLKDYSYIILHNQTALHGKVRCLTNEDTWQYEVVE